MKRKRDNNARDGKPSSKKRSKPHSPTKKAKAVIHNSQGSPSQLADVANLISLQPGCRLLALPPELRIAIWTLVIDSERKFKDSGPDLVVEERYVGLWKDNHVPGLLKTCRKIRAETLPIFWCDVLVHQSTFNHIDFRPLRLIPKYIVDNASWMHLWVMHVNKEEYLRQFKDELRALGYQGRCTVLYFDGL